MYHSLRRTKNRRRRPLLDSNHKISRSVTTPAQHCSVFAITLKLHISLVDATIICVCVIGSTIVERFSSSPGHDGGDAYE